MTADGASRQFPLAVAKVSLPTHSRRSAAILGTVLRAPHRTLVRAAVKVGTGW